MATISIGDAIAEGFTLIRRRPLSVLAWGAVRTAFAASVFSLMSPLYFSLFSQALDRAKTGIKTPPDLSSMVQLQSASWLISLVGMFVGVMVYCAVCRSVLHPEQNRFAYLRLGTAEMFLFLLAIGAYFALFIGILIAFVPGALIVGIAFAAHAPGLGALLGVVAAIAAVVFLIWVLFRLALVIPMTVQDGRFHLFDAWSLTRGHAGALFLVGLCMFVILLVIEAVIGAITVALGIGFLSQMAGGFRNLPTFFSQSPASIVSTLLPALAVMGLFSIPISGALMAIMGAPWARAYRDLAQPDLAATFS